MAADSLRAQKVRKALMREVSDIIAKEVKEPELANHVISVTDVEVTTDLRYAKIFISIMGNEDKRDDVMEILSNATPRIRSEIGRRIRLRYTPEITLKFDDSLERGTRLTHLLEQISRGEV